MADEYSDIGPSCGDCCSRWHTKGIVRLTPELLASLLGYPDGFAVAVKQDGGQFLVSLHGSEDLSPVKEGEVIPEVEMGPGSLTKV